MDEFHRRALRAEAALRKKEEENAILQQRLKLYDTRWSEYELKMKSMEQTWQKQLTSLQVIFFFLFFAFVKFLIVFFSSSIIYLVSKMLKGSSSNKIYALI